jgi:hypothetical protein
MENNNPDKMIRTNIYLTMRQICEIDEARLRIRQQTGKTVFRTELIRSIIAAVFGW